MIQEGLVRAIVTDNKDPENLGRVQIRYPWLGSKSGQQATEWARCARMQSNSGSGQWFLPEINDEVLVGYEFGERDRPIILGSLYTKDAPPPTSGRDGDHNSNGENNLSFFKTKSGHMLLFDDLDSNKAVILKDSEGNHLTFDTSKKKISLEDAGKNLLEMDHQMKMVTLKDCNGNQIMMSQAGISIQDKNGNQMQLSPSGGVSLKDSAGNEFKAGGSGLTVKCSGSINIEGSANVTINGSAGVSLGSGAAEALLKGTTFLALFNAHVHQTPDGTSSPPSAPLPPTVLSTKVRTE